MAATQIPEVSAAELEIKRRGRRRLVGAICVGLLAIVFLPMIFDNEPRRSGVPIKPQDISVQVPSKEGQPALPPPSPAPVVVAAQAQSANEADAVPPSKLSAATEAAKIVSSPPPVPPKAAAVEPVKPAKAEKAAKADTSTPVEKTGFVVQLGVFSDADNAKQAIAKVKEAKLSVYTETIPVKSGNATRVRVGPFSTREKADAALAQVKLAGAEGKIVPLK